jgi:hypothetical protein
MFNTQRWVDLSERSYGYKGHVEQGQYLDLHLIKVKNEIGSYTVAPSFGDFIHVTKYQMQDIEKFARENPESALRIKVCCDIKPVSREFNVDDAGFVHELEFESYEDWRRNNIKCKFRNQINQGMRSGLVARISTDFDDLVSFWELHARLRVAKFRELPQPKQFFVELHKLYIEQELGFIISAYDGVDNLVAGIVVLIEGDTAYYKYAASRLDSLKLRPNNYLFDRLIFHLNELKIRKLNLGYTGASVEYGGLRKYKLSAGASESSRYILTTAAYSALNLSRIDQLNEIVGEFINQDPSLTEVDAFSQCFYKNFI